MHLMTHYFLKGYPYVSFDQGEVQARFAHEQLKQSLNFKLLGSPGIDPRESVPSANVAWRARTTTLFLLGS